MNTPNRRVGTMPSFAYPPKGAICVEENCTHPAVRMLISVKNTLSPPIASPACATCADAAITARRARLAGAGETYRVGTGFAFIGVPKAPEPTENPGNSRAETTSTRSKASGGQNGRSGNVKRR